LKIGTYILISVFSYFQVLFVTFQQRNVSQGRTVSVFFSSIMLGVLLVFVQRSYVGGDNIAALCFVLFGALGASSGIVVHKKMFKGKI
jgi:drug/metabolite transporter (DMT)-like permease